MPVKILYGGIVPSNDGFVSGEFLAIPVLAQVIAESFVDPGNVGLARRALLPAQGESSIQFGKTLFVGLRTVIHVRRRFYRRPQRLGIEVIEAGGHQE